MKYEKCIYNTLIEQMFNSTTAILCLAAYFPGSTEAMYEELLEVEEEYKDELYGKDDDDDDKPMNR